MSEPTNAVPGDDGAFSADPPQPSMLVRCFRNRFGHWRAGWRMAAYVIASFACAVPLGFAAAQFEGGGSGPGGFSWAMSLRWLAGDVALIVAALAVLRWFDRRPMALLGLGYGRGWLVELLGGCAAGLAATGVLVAGLSVSGAVRLGVSADPGAGLRSLPLLLWIFVLAAVLEELVFRGYLLQALAEGSHPLIAGFLFCMAFTWAHVDNPDVTVAGVVNIFLAGVVLTVLYFKTRRLWLPIGFHLSWNLCQSWLWGFDVSGIAIDDSLLVMTPIGADLVTGGEFGLEGSALTTLFFLVLLGWLARTRALRPVGNMASLWRRYPVGFGAPPSGEDTVADHSAVASV